MTKYVIILESTYMQTYSMFANCINCKMTSHAFWIAPSTKNLQFLLLLCSLSEKIMVRPICGWQVVRVYLNTLNFSSSRTFFRKISVQPQTLTTWTLLHLKDCSFTQTCLDITWVTDSFNCLVFADMHCYIFFIFWLLAKEA